MTLQHRKALKCPRCGTINTEDYHGDVPTLPRFKLICDECGMVWEEEHKR
jgi:uncharacterized Zn finger protein